VGGPAPAARGDGVSSEDELVAVAEEAARAAGAILADRFVRGAGAVHAKSTPTDLASEADLAAEKAILDLLSAVRPGDAVLAEEGGGAEPSPGQIRWVVDPLDGTINFLFGIPQWCVSVAATRDGETLAGVIFNPDGDELFAATASGPVTLNGEPVSPRAAAGLDEALVVTGFAYDAGLRAHQGRVVASLLPRVRDVRRMGSAALDLAWLAAGRYDAYYERGVKAWDIAAGALLCRRAGLRVEDLPARDGLPHGIVAGPPALVGALGAFDL
jgi:myo-inositol-1(or 4)-monophosphatase